MSMKDIRNFFKPISKNGTSNSIKQSTEKKSSESVESPSKLKAHIDKKDSKNTKKAKSKEATKKSEPNKVEIISSDDEKLKKKSPELSKKKSPTKSREKSSSSVNLNKLTAKKESPIAIDSDSDDPNIINSTPNKPTVKGKKRKLQVIHSDSEDEKPKPIISKSKEKKKEEPHKMKPVSITDIFGKAVKQSTVETGGGNSSSVDHKMEKKSKKMKKTEIGIHEDKNFEGTLMDLDDDDFFLQNEDILEKTIESAMHKSPSKEKVEIVKNNSGNKMGNDLNKSGTKMKNDLNESVTKTKSDLNKSEPKLKISSDKTSNLNKNESSKKRLLEKEDSIKDGTPGKKGKFEHTDSGFDDQDRYEKRKYCAMQYQQYLNRSGPKNHGSKEMPKGKPDCLSNLCFLRTGVLDSLESSEFEELIKTHGGRVIHSVTKKLNYVVVGDDPGPAKLDKAKGYGIPMLSEDELLDMILEKSGKPKKYTIQKVESFEDGGINESFKSTEVDPDEGDTTDIDSEIDVDVKRDSKVESHKKNSPEKKKLPEQKKNLEKKKSPEKGKSPNKKTIDVVEEKKPKLIEEKILNAKTNDGPTTSSRESIQCDVDNLSLSEKYKPKELKQIVGQQLNNSNMNKLKKWLECWHQNEKLRKQKKIPQPRPWDKNNDGAYYKCALLSGPPGVGKTTTATLVAESLGFDIVEFNASDTRSKKLLQQELGSALSTKTISSFNMNNSALDSKRVILMDEVDGMAGNEDRGGMQELINLIKSSKTPIICMCNDRQHQKMRSLSNYCFDLRFDKPKLQQILGFVMSICCKEGIKVTPQVVSEIINGTTCDIRQTLNQLSMLTNLDTNVSLEQAQKDSAASKKDTVLGPWQVCKMVFNEEDQKKMSLIDKSRLFFYDYSMGPLFVQENYLKVQPHVERKQVMKNVAAAAGAISMGATIDKKIRESNNWSLLDMQALYSSVLPGHYMSGHFTGAIDFPSWLGKNSKRNKLARLNNELAMHTKVQTSGGALANNLDYSKALLRAIATPLKKKGLEGVSDAVEIMKSYQLLREDLDSLVELCNWPKQKNMMDGVDVKVKAAFTRLYKKEVPAFSYSATAGVSKKKTTSLYDENDEFNEDDGEDASETEDTIEKDSLIKAKTKSKTQGKKEKESKTASTSKQASKPKGKGKK